MSCPRDSHALLPALGSLCATAGLLTILATDGLPAQDPDKPDDPAAAQPTRRSVAGREPGEELGLLRRQHATGDWGGARTWLHERGIVPEVFLTVDASWLASGGVDTKSGALRGLLDVTLSIDTERLLGHPGGLLFADFQVQRGEDGSLDSGDLQVYSNIDGEDRTQLAEIWYEQVLLERSLLFKVGKSDANVDFAYVDHGARFVNSSFGFSPTILAFPTYPDPAFGAALFVRPGAGFYSGLGIYDGALQSGVETGRKGPRTLFGDPSDLFGIAELGLSWAGSWLPGRVGVGAWHDTGDFARWRGGTDEGSEGFYLVLDQDLWRPGGAAGGAERGLGAFLQYGWADPEVSPVEHHVGAGLEWTGALPSRPSDTIGLGGTWVSFSDAPAAGLSGEGELAVELFYGLRLTPWWVVKPDVQWIHDPGGIGLDDALVLTVRTEVTF